jgi:uncharacterized membrane protein YbhN (UPF0104 family)
LGAVNQTSTANIGRRPLQIARAFARAVRQRVGWDTLGVVFSISLVAAACVALVYLLRDVDIGKVGAALSATPISSVVVAGVLAAASYFTLTFYDFFALRTIGRTHIPYRVAAFTGLLSYTIGHNVGATVFTGGLVRFRIYKTWGLDLIDIARIAFITGLTFWLGNGVALGVGIAYAPEAASAINQLLLWLNRGLAVGTLAAIAGYLLWLMPQPRVIGRNGWKVTLPSAPLTLLQIGIGIADLGFAALAMYVLISAYTPVDLLAAVMAYVLAALLGFASHAPGGLGVIDAAILLALPQVEKEQLLAALLIFRCLYFLAPFCLAVIAFGARELWLSAASR